MTTFTSDDFVGHYPVGTAAVICANTYNEARALLDAELERRGLKQDPAHPYTLKEMPQEPLAAILCDGDY